MPPSSRPVPSGDAGVRTHPGLCGDRGRADSGPDQPTRIGGLRLTRIDLPFLLGTVVTTDRLRAKALGYLFHFFFGFFFALGYYALFRALGRAGWSLGLAFGLVHGVFTGSALVNVLLPVVHPRMGTPLSSIESETLLEPPGFMMLNYGRGSPLASLVAHVAYGALVGGLAALGH